MTCTCIQILPCVGPLWLVLSVLEGQPSGASNLANLMWSLLLSETVCSPTPFQLLAFGLTVSRWRHSSTLLWRLQTPQSASCPTTFLQAGPDSRTGRHTSRWASDASLVRFLSAVHSLLGVQSPFPLQCFRWPKLWAELCPPQTLYVQTLTSSTSKDNCIWRMGL